MRKIFSKRLVSLILVIAMVFSMTAVAFASGEEVFEEYDVTAPVFTDVTTGETAEAWELPAEETMPEGIFEEVTEDPEESVEEDALVFEDVFAPAEETVAGNVKVGELTIPLPASFDNKVSAVTDGEITWFVHEASREAGVSGKLFGIAAYKENTSWMEQENMEGLLAGMNCQYVWVRPTETDLYTEETMQEYLELSNELDYIKAGISIEYDEADMAAAMTGSTNAQKLFNYMVAYGYTKQAAAALVGNVMAEAGGGLNFSLHAVEVGTGIGIGMCQWSFGRRTNFENYCKSLGIHWTNSTLEIQTQFLIKELKGDYGTMWVFYSGYSSSKSKYKMTYSAFTQSTDIELATGAFCCSFERPSEAHMNLSYRVSSAKQVYNAYAGSVTSSIADATVSMPSTSYAYTGSAIVPEVTVSLAGKVLVKGTDYTVTATNNVNPGTATLTVLGKGTYTGSVSKTFLILNGRGSGITQIDGKYYYINSDGSASLGWKLVGNDWYYFASPSGEALIGFWKLGNCTYYFGQDGKMGSGWVTIHGGTYYMNANGQVQFGWNTINGKRYYLDETTGKMSAGWIKVSDVWYYQTADGVLTGFNRIGNCVYCFADDGKMLTGWQVVNGSAYYFRSNGAMVTGLYSIDGNLFCFTSTGVRQNGWVKVDESWYYFTTNGAVKGFAKLGNCTYYFSQEGIMQTGWITDNGTRYFANTSGKLLMGLYKIEDGLYFLKDPTGAMQTGWRMVNNSWYYFGTDGRALLGKQQVGNSLYWFDDDGKMYVGFFDIDGDRFYANSSGQLATGFKKIDGKLYHFNERSCVMTASGWRSINQNGYYVNQDGSLATGLQAIGSCTYGFNENGVMLTGLQNFEGKLYYFNSSGHALTGTYTIDGKTYIFGADYAAVTPMLTATAFVGDSRTVGMMGAVGSVANTTFIGEVGKGLSWLKSTGATKLSSSVTKYNGRENIVLWLGINDLGNINGYISYYKTLMSTYPECKFRMVGIGPVDETTARRNGYTVTNAQITSFNNQMKAAFPNNYVDLYSHMMGTGFSTADGIHYTSSTYKAIYNYLLTTLS